MTVSGITPTAAIPADVRADGKQAVERYESAQSFEKMLVGQLTQSMLQGTPLAEGPYADSVQNALTDGIEQGGGLGLSESLYRSMTMKDAKT